MPDKLKESISRISLTVFFVMLLISLTFLATAGHRVSLYACLGFFPLLTLTLGVEKHRWFACVGLLVVLLLIIGDHTKGQKLNRKLREVLNRSNSKRIEELESKLKEYENNNNDKSNDKNAIDTDSGR